MIIFFLKAHQMGLFDAPVPIKAHSTKTGGYVRAHTRIMKVSAKTPKQKPMDLDFENVANLINNMHNTSDNQQKTGDNKMDKITYTFPKDFAVPQLKGVTVSGGVPAKIIINKKVVDVVNFDHQLNGKNLVVKLDGKPDLQKLVDEYYRSKDTERRQQQIALESAVPGINEIRKLYNAIANDDLLYHEEFNSMMESEGNDGARPPKKPDESLRNEYAAMVKKYPRAALYIQAESQANNTHWADNTGKGSAARNAMRILADGGSIDDARQALQKRDELDIFN